LDKLPGKTETLAEIIADSIALAKVTETP